MTTDPHRRPPSTCAASTTDGTPCRARPLHGRDRCWHHADDLADQRAEARARGGRNSSTVARRLAAMPDPLRDLLDGLVEVFAATRAGEVDPARAQALASVARAIVRAWDVAEIDDRLDEIERALSTVGAAGQPHLRAVGS